METIKTTVKQTGAVFYIHGWDTRRKKHKGKIVRGIFENGLKATMSVSKINFQRLLQINLLHKKNFTIKKKSTPEQKVKVREVKEFIMSQITLPEQDVAHCLYRLYYGKKWVVAKAKSLVTAINMFAHYYAYFTVYKHNAVDYNPNFFYKMFQYIQKNPGLKFTLWVTEPRNDYQLLMAEQSELYRAIQGKYNKRHNLNGNITCYLPQMAGNGMYGGWLSPADVKKYRKEFRDTVTFDAEESPEPELATSES